MQSPLYERAFAALHGFIPLDNAEAPSFSHNKSIPSDASSGEQNEKAQEPPPSGRPRAFWFIFLALSVSEFTRAIDAVILPVILPAVVKDLKATTTQGYMSGSIFLLCQTVFQPVYAGFAEAFGNKNLILMALLIFAGASVLAGFAQNPNWMIGARALQGAGAGGMDVMCGLIVTDMVKLSERGKFNGLLQLFGAMGMVAGTILGSAIETKLSWRWVFFINPFLVAGPATVLIIFLRDRGRQGNLWQNLKSVDWSGMALISLSFTSLLFGLLTGGAVRPWSSATVLVSLILGVIGVILFIFHQRSFVERYTAAEPLMPLRLFSHRTAALGFVVVLLHAVLLASFVNFFFIYVHVSSGLSILSTSLTTIPSSSLLLGSAAVTGIITSRTKRYRIFIIIGGLLLSAGFGAFISLRETASRVEQLFIQLPFALGAGIALPARLLATQAPQRRTDFAKSSATLSFLFNLGQCFGIPIGATIYETVWEHIVKEDVKSGRIPEEFFIPSQKAEESGELIKQWPKTIADLYRHIMSVSISKIWIVMTALSVLIFIMGVVMKEVPLIDEIEEKHASRDSEDDQESTVRLVEAGA